MLPDWMWKEYLSDKCLCGWPSCPCRQYLLFIISYKMRLKVNAVRSIFNVVIVLATTALLFKDLFSSDVLEGALWNTDLLINMLLEKNFCRC